MAGGATVVLDVGKTIAKLSLWAPGEGLIARETRPNAPGAGARYAELDAAGVTSWIGEVLRRFSECAEIDAIVPVAHGAAAAIVRDGALVCAPMDYEAPIPAAVRRDYDSVRDPFRRTGSPALPNGLNLGAQLFYLDRLQPGIFVGATIVTWPQYWAWLLSGVAATEVTSLGCHSDLWRPDEGDWSDLTRVCGFHSALAPVRAAADALGTITPEWARRTGLGRNVQVHCGLHDSNAALLAARGFSEIAQHDSTVLSTGTWFVSMRSPRGDIAGLIEGLPEARDCLVNVDAYGASIPSARFMGGREIEILSGIDTRRVDIKPDQPALLAAIGDVLASGAMAIPTFTAGVGPFPKGQGRWIAMPADPLHRRAAVCIYAALCAEASLSLIGAKDAILIEGRFAEAEVFVRALATLRPQDQIYYSHAEHDVSYGALRLLNPALASPAKLQRATPLEHDLDAYAAAWGAECARIEAAS